MTGTKGDKRESKKLKEELDEQTKLMECLRSQIEDKSKEINRLKCQASGKMELGEMKNMTTAQLIHEMKSMDKVNKDLKKQLHDALSKQHEAMMHAVRLAKKNQQLEDELRDVDRVALAVEEECNSTLKGNLEKVTAIQEKLDTSLHKVYHLEKKIGELKEKNNEMKKKIEEIENRNKENKMNLKKALEEKDNALKAVRINERELTKKVEKLSHTLQNQKHRIIELEEILKENEAPGEKSEEPNHLSRRIHIRMTRSAHSSQVSEEDFNEMDQRNSDEIVNNGNDNRVTRVEIQESTAPGGLRNKDKKLTELKRSCDELTEEINMLEDLDKGSSVRIHSRSSSPIRSFSIKTVLARLERERDLAKADVERLQEEVNSLRERLQMATEVQLEEKTRFQRCLAQEEKRVRELETECRDLHKHQGLLRGKVEGQEESISKLKNYLKTATDNLKREENLNKQLKSLQEKTERSLLKSQEKAIKLEVELKFNQQQMNDMEVNQEEINALRREAATLQETVFKLSNDKDVPGKQQEIASLKRQLENVKSLNTRQKESLASLEKLLSSKRKESIEHKVSNRQLQMEVERLQNVISELQRSLEAETSEVKYYQRKAQELNNKLEEIQRDRTQGRRQSRLTLEEHTRSRSQSPSTPTRTKVTFETEDETLDQPVTRQTNIKMFTNTKDPQQRLRNSGSTNKKKSVPITSPKKSCSFKAGNCSYNVEFEGDVHDPKLTVKKQGDTTYRLRQYGGYSSKRSPRTKTRLSVDEDLSNPRDDGRTCSTSPQVHFHANLPSGSEVSVELEEQDAGGAYYSYRSSSS